MLSQLSVMMLCCKFQSNSFLDNTLKVIKQKVPSTLSQGKTEGSFELGCGWKTLHLIWLSHSVRRREAWQPDPSSIVLNFFNTIIIYRGGGGNAIFLSCINILIKIHHPGTRTRSVILLIPTFFSRLSLLLLALEIKCPGGEKLLCARLSSTR